MELDWSIATINKPISRTQLQAIADRGYGEMVKVVVDLRRKMLALGGQMHVDMAALLQKDGAHKEDLWGVRLFPAQSGDAFIEFVSQINVRPGNPTVEIADQNVRTVITELIESLIVGDSVGSKT